MARWTGWPRTGERTDRCTRGGKEGCREGQADGKEGSTDGRTEGETEQFEREKALLGPP